MSKKHTMKPVSAALGTAFAVSLAASPIAHADANPFGISDLSSGYQVAAEGQCGASKTSKEGQCGEGKKAAKEGNCGEGKAAKEGKCAGEKKAKEGSCGEKAMGSKEKEGKCGEGKCGGSK